MASPCHPSVGETTGVQPPCTEAVQGAGQSWLDASRRQVHFAGGQAEAQSGASALGSQSLAVTLISGDSGALVLGSSWSLLPEGMELEYSPSTSSHSPLSSRYRNDREARMLNGRNSRGHLSSWPTAVERALGTSITPCLGFPVECSSSSSAPRFSVAKGGLGGGWGPPGGSHRHLWERGLILAAGGGGVIS